MFLSSLMETNATRQGLEVFGGYNHNVKITDGEFYDMHDMTSDHYPAMASRGKHGTYKLWESQEGEATPHNINGMIGKDALCYVDGKHFYINNKEVEGFELDDSPKLNPKQLVSMGSYVVIFPDKKYINTTDVSDKGSLEATWTGVVKATMCNLDGEDYVAKHTQPNAPENPEAGDYWIDTSSKPHALKQWSDSSSMWVSIATSYIKLRGQRGFAEHFNRYDGVYIESAEDADVPIPKDFNEYLNKYSVIMEVHKGEGQNNDYIVITGFLDEVVNLISIKVTRDIPNMDFVVESNNRLWGCRYGESKNGKIVNEIYASKLGDFKNWNCFMGASTDSYAVSVGTDGVFTGAISYMGYPIFFKESAMHKLYGQYPANYQIQTTPCRGVQRGAGNSLAIVGEALLYKTRNGVAIYEGSLPTEISNAFGNIKYTGREGDDMFRNGAIGASLGQKYFINMKSEADDKWYTFSFDLNTNMWFKEGEGRILEFCSNEGELYYLTDRSTIKTWLGSGTVDDDPVEWMVESGRIGMGAIGKKYISRYVVNLMLEAGSHASFFIEYDSEGKWRHIQTIKGIGVRTQSFPIRPRRCDHFKIRIEGKGDVKIFSIVKTVEEGSER